MFFGCFLLVVFGVFVCVFCCFLLVVFGVFVVFLYINVFVCVCFLCSSGCACPLSFEGWCLVG